MGIGRKQVAPAQHSMCVCPDQASLQPQPKISGNGCPCRCCGAAPPDITVANMKKHGNEQTRWVQTANGRIIEYYVYGATDDWERVLVQLNGSMGSAKFFSEMVSMTSVLKEKKVKAVSVNLPGHGFTSGEPNRRMGDFAKSCVEPVLMAEKLMVDAGGASVPLMVEGSSFGSAHANSVMWYFQDRITHVHLHVPALSQDIAKELGLKPISEGCKCDGDLVTTCFLAPKQWMTCLPCCCANSPMLFCCCSCMAPLAPGGADGLNKLPGYAEIAEAHPQMAEKQFQASEVMKNHSIAHTLANGAHGMIYNSLLGQLYRSWGFHPFDDIPVAKVERMKMMVSYGIKDPSSPESHGEYMAEYYSKICNKGGQMFKNVAPEEVEGNEKGGKCLVNHREGGHEAHFIPFCKGELLRKLLEL